MSLHRPNSDQKSPMLAQKVDSDSVHGGDDAPLMSEESESSHHKVG